MLLTIHTLHGPVARKLMDIYRESFDYGLFDTACGSRSAPRTGKSTVCPGLCIPSLSGKENRTV